uniref:Fructose-bisphosphate aldolase n=1 Tax=Salix viminalis TaxID=40686 RepID=A0A6N2MUW0_SALVM
MASASFLKSSPVLDKSEFVKGQTLRLPSASIVRCRSAAAPSVLTVRAGSYAEELVKTAKTIASPGRVQRYLWKTSGLDRAREQLTPAYRTLLVTVPGLGDCVSGAILFEETLYQSTTDGKKMVDVLVEQKIVPGIKVDKGLVPLAGSNDESWCQGLDGLASRTAAYYQQGARFAKWRTVVSIPNGPSALAVKEAAWGLARYAAISQDNGLVPIVEPEILLDGEHGIERTFEVAQKVWAEVFFYMAENNVLFEGILLKPSMVTPGAECKDRATPEQVADYTLKLLHRSQPSRNHGKFHFNFPSRSETCTDFGLFFEQFLSGGQSEVEATMNLNAMNQSANPWHVSFSYARALQNTCLKTWGGRPENVKAAQEALLIRAKANSLAQLGKYTGEGESDEAKKGMFVKNYAY